MPDSCAGRSVFPRCACHLLDRGSGMPDPYAARSVFSRCACHLLDRGSGMPDPYCVGEACLARKPLFH